MWTDGWETKCARHRTVCLQARRLRRRRRKDIETRTAVNLSKQQRRTITRVILKKNICVTNTRTERNECRQAAENKTKLERKEKIKERTRAKNKQTK